MGCGSSVSQPVPLVKAQAKAEGTGEEKTKEAPPTLTATGVSAGVSAGVATREIADQSTATTTDTTTATTTATTATAPTQSAASGHKKCFQYDHYDGVSPAPKVVEELLARYRPTFHFHPEEKYYPTSIDFYLAHCSLWFHKTAEKADRVKLLDIGQVNPNSMCSQAVENEFSDIRKTSKRSRFSLHPKQGIYRGMNIDEDTKQTADPSTEKLSKIPVYADFRKRTETVWEIRYITFYAYNGMYSWPTEDVAVVHEGAHQADVEHISVRLDASDVNNIKLQEVFYSSHGAGQWLPASKVQFEANSTTKIYCYVALNGHGLYPNPGAYSIASGLARDHCEVGPAWTPSEIIPLMQCDGVGWKEKYNTGWIWYSGTMGSNSVPPLLVGLHKWCKNEAPTPSTTTTH